MINTDFAQYKSYSEANAHAKRLSEEIITDVKSDLAKPSLEEVKDKIFKPVVIEDVNEK